MTDRYEHSAQEVEAKIVELEARRDRFAAHPTLHTRVASVQAEIDSLKKLDLNKWRATGKWANEIWGTK